MERPQECYVLRSMLPVLALAAALVLASDHPEHIELHRRIDALLTSTPLIDGHNDLAWAIREHGRGLDGYDLTTRTPGHTDIPRLRAGHVGAQLWSVYVPTAHRADTIIKTQLEQIDLARSFIAAHPQHLALALAADDIDRIFASGRIASLIALEGGHVIADSLAVLRSYHALGARAMTLTHIESTGWADAADRPARHGGLSSFGESVVREMNRLGMLVDISHVADATMDDALRVSAAPVVFTHSSARARADVPRNVPDDILRRLPANGGLVMVTFVPGFVSRHIAEARRSGTKPASKATLADVADHLGHIKKITGPDHIGLGSDFDGMSAAPTGLHDVSTFPALFVELARRGWTDEELKKLAGANFLRVLRQVEATAKSLQTANP